MEAALSLQAVMRRTLVYANAAEQSSGSHLENDGEWQDAKRQESAGRLSSLPILFPSTPGLSTATEQFEDTSPIEHRMFVTLCSLLARDAISASSEARDLLSSPTLRAHPDNQLIIGRVLGQIVLTKHYRMLLCTVIIRALVPSWRGQPVKGSRPSTCGSFDTDSNSDPDSLCDSDGEQVRSKCTDGALIPLIPCVASFQAFSATLAEGCLHVGVPLQVGLLLRVRDAAAGKLYGARFDAALLRVLLAARVAALCRTVQLERLPPRDAAVDLMRLFVCEDSVLTDEAQEKHKPRECRWLILALFTAACVSASVPPSCPAVCPRP